MPRMDGVGRGPEREPEHDNADDRATRAHQKRGLVAAPGQRGRREQEESAYPADELAISQPTAAPRRSTGTGPRSA